MGVERNGPVPIQATTDVSFREGFLAVTNIIFAYRTLGRDCRQFLKYAADQM